MRPGGPDGAEQEAEEAEEAVEAAGAAGAAVEVVVEVVEAAAAGAAARVPTTLRPTRRSSRTKWMISLTVSRNWKGTKTSRPDSRIVTTSDQESTSNMQEGRRVIS